MCTSHVACNTQPLVSMGKLRKMRQCGLSMQLQGMTKMSSMLPSLLRLRVETDAKVDGDSVHGLQYVGEDATAPWTELSK